MKKRLALLVSAAMICGLTACGTETANGEASSQPEGGDGTSFAQVNTAVDEPGDDVADLTFMWWGSAVRGERTQAAFDLYRSNNPGVTFAPESVEWSDYWNQLEVRAGSDSLPDIVQIDYSFLERSVNNGMLVELTPYLADGTLDLSGVDPGLISAGSVNGRIYAICGGVNVPALMYNKTLTDKLGIEIKDNMTLEEFYVVAKEVYEKSGVKTDMPYGMAYNFLPYILRAQDITKLYNSDSLNVESAAAFQEFFDIYEIGRRDGWIIGNDVHAGLTDVSVEQSPLVCHTTPETQSWCGFFWSNQLTAMTQAAPEDMDIAITTWPSSEPAKSDFLKPAQFFAVTTDAGENEAVAVRVVNYLLNSRPANELMLGERGVPASAVIADAIAPLMDENGRLVTAFINDVVAPNSSNISPSDPEMATKVYTYADGLIRRILDGELTATEAAQELFEQGNQIMKGTS
ncbi:MAG: ABC transporter substrate-binding protein [Acetatifactor sp.]|nr:ABC transporter substrate-binding protein [Acetatifactor sp.]